MSGTPDRVRRSAAIEALFDRLGRDVVAVQSPIDDRDDGGHPLHPHEVAAVERAGPARRREFTIGRRCAHAALAELGAPDVPIRVGDRREPVWPDGVVGSITHTTTWCAAVVGRSEPDRSTLGLDAERVGRVDDEIAQVVFTAAERRSLAGADDRPIAATVGFAAKEAFYKAQFPVTRAWVDFDAVEVEVSGDAHRSGTVEIHRSDAREVTDGWAWPVCGAWAVVDDDPATVVVAVVSRRA